MNSKFVFSIYSGEFHLGYTKNDIQGFSWYHLLHWDSLREAQNKHRLSMFKNNNNNNNFCNEILL